MPSMDYFTANISSPEKISESFPDQFNIPEDFKGVDIQQIATGPNYLALLTSTGRVCRIPYQTNRVDFSPRPEKHKKVINLSDDPPLTQEQSLRLMDSFVRGHPSTTSRAMPFYIDSPFMPDLPVLNRQFRGGRVDVPDNLVEQVRTILQGRNRDIIRRELARSNLNVNSAVNALLNREEVTRLPDTEDSATSSLLIMRHSRPSFNRRSFSIDKENKAHDMKQKTQFILDFSRLEWWESETRFSAIGAMFSDLVVVDIKGYLHKWTWELPYPYDSLISQNQHTHEKALIHGLNLDTIVLLSCSYCRATALTASNKLFFFLDSSIFGAEHLEGFQHISKTLSEVKVKQIHCNNIYSVALLTDGSLWWWGVPPFNQRLKTMWAPAKSPKQGKKVSKEILDLEVGACVTYRGSDCLQPGLLAYYFDGSTIKMGRLGESLTSEMTTALFFSADGEDCDTSRDNSDITSRRRSKPPNSNEERWLLEYVVFLSERTQNYGTVIKIDNDSVLVEFSRNRQSSKKDIMEVCRLNNSRIFKAKDLVVVRRVPRKGSFLPHCQTIPRRIVYPKNSRIISIHSSDRGLNVLTRLRADRLVFDFFCPGSKLIDSRKIHGLIHLFIPPHDKSDIKMIVLGDLMVVDHPINGQFLFSRDCQGQFRPLIFPTVPNLQLINMSVPSLSGFSLITTIFEMPISLSTNGEHFGNLIPKQLFVFNRNIIHYLAQLCHTSEVSFEGSHISWLITELESLSQDKNFSTLVCHKDLNGLTPFLYSLTIRSYQFTLKLLYLIKTKCPELFIPAIFPAGSEAHLNPISILCSNECCSYLFTGNTHINQEVYECKSCGIYDSLCICSECALTCHRDHLCFPKTQSPTAFCDCWEKCICQCMFVGHSNSRREILRILIEHDELFTFKGFDHILVYLIETFTRRKRERTSSKISAPNLDTNDSTSILSERAKIIGFNINSNHSPTRFLSFALHLLLGVKQCVSSFFLTQAKIYPIPDRLRRLPYFTSYLNLLPTQTPGNLIDAFMFKLFFECDKSFSSVLLNTLKSSFNEENFIQSNNNILSICIRSCIRIFTSLTTAMSPLLIDACARRCSLSCDQFKILYRIMPFFKRFPLISVFELIRHSCVILEPVMHGTLSPRTNEFPLFTKMNEVNQFVATLFTIPPNQENVRNNPPENLYLDDGDEFLSSDPDYVTPQESPSNESLYSQYSLSDLQDDDHISVDVFTHDADFIDSRSDQTTETDDDDPDIGDSHRSEFLRPPRISLYQVNERTRRVPRDMFLNENHQWTMRPTNEGRYESLSLGRTVSDSLSSDSYSLVLTHQSGLARTFSILLRLAADICLRKNLFSHSLINSIFELLKRPFTWIFETCDSIETRLRLGIHGLDHSINPNKDKSDTTRSRRRDDRSYYVRGRTDLFTNLLSITRSSCNEHHGLLPSIEMSGNAHIAYALDGTLYFISSYEYFLTKIPPRIHLGRSSLPLGLDYSSFFSKSFFHRTSSTLTFYNVPPDLSKPSSESLPLSISPSLLRLGFKKIDLFSSDEIDLKKDPLLSFPYSFEKNVITSNSNFLERFLNAGLTTLFIRWLNCVDIFAQAFADTVVTERASVFHSVCRFESKESAFRTVIDTVHSPSSVSELVLEGLERDPEKLLGQTFKAFNAQFQKKDPASKSIIPPFAKIKVMFKDEAGEGSGVTRNFLSAISQAIISLSTLPDLSGSVDVVNSNDNQRTTDDNRFIHISSSGSNIFFSHLARVNASNRDTSWPEFSVQDNTLPFVSNFRLRRSNNNDETITLTQIESMSRNPSLLASRRIDTKLRNILKKKVREVIPTISINVVDSLMQLSPDVIHSCITDDDYLRARVSLILKLFGDLHSHSDGLDSIFDIATHSEDAPLFFQPSKSSFYFPICAKKSSIRLNAYRNVGRVIGLSLFFSEVVPLFFVRPVLKFLLDQPISFHDLAFFDPIQYESLRLLVLEARKLRSENSFPVPLHGLNFCVNVAVPNSAPLAVDLVPSGQGISVTSHNAEEYVQAYAEYLMLDSVRPELTALREGLYDMIHPFILHMFSAEDLRLLLNGAYEISVDKLKEIVVFSTEGSGFNVKKVERFKKWFWEVVEGMSTTQVSDLLLFWTSSPLLSVAENSTKPNITIKQPSAHLPSSNTCIMRLYLPMYKDKNILREKLCKAITTKTFGFV